MLHILIAQSTRLMFNEMILESEADSLGKYHLARINTFKC
jgi:hypothetical protein